jgi:hypothetical protein
MGASLSELIAAYRPLEARSPDGARKHFDTAGITLQMRVER